MNFDFNLFFKALGLAIVLEGFVWALFPDQMRDVMQKVIDTSTSERRRVGIIGIFVGMLTLWLASKLV